MRLATPLLLVLFFTSCRPESYIPRPRGYARIDTPRHAYQRFERPGFPYAFEYPVYASISKDSVMSGVTPDNPYWINIDFPTFGGSLYISYKTIDAAQPLDTLLGNVHYMSYFHAKRADFINAPSFHTANGVHGILYNVGGNAASSYQFFATDSTRHFLRGSLYFNTTPNADSLKPVTDFLHTDIQHLLGTLEWK